MSDRMKKLIEAGEVIRGYDIELGRKLEREQIVNLLKYEASEWLSHDGSCDCKIRGEEVLRLIKKIEDSE
jgi:hypothetical protein